MYGCENVAINPPYDPNYNRRMTAFNLARSLFPYDKEANVEDILSAASQIDKYLHATV